MAAEKANEAMRGRNIGAHCVGRTATVVRKMPSPARGKCLRGVKLKV